MASLFRNLTQSNPEAALEFNAVAEAAFTDNAICELTMELFHVAESADIAGIIGGYAVQEGAAQADVLLENIIKTSYAKIREAFKKFGEKMKAFFEQVRKVLKSIFMKGKDFVKEYKQELKGKSTKGFKYTGYQYQIDKGNTAADKIFDAVESNIEKVLGLFKSNSADTYKTILDDEAAFKEKLGQLQGYKISDNFADSVAKGMAKHAGLSNVDDITELKAELVKLYRGSEEKEEIKEFEGVSVDAMCSFIEASEAKIGEFTKAEKDFTTAISNIIKVIDSLDNTSGDSAEQTAAYKLMSKVSSKLTTYLNTGKAAIDIKVAIYKEAANSYESVLRSFLRYRAFKGAVKENTSVTEGMSLVDQMLGLNQ